MSNINTIKSVRDSYNYLQRFHEEAGNRKFSYTELKKVVHSQKHIEDSIPTLLKMIEELNQRPEELSQQIALKSIINHALHAFPKSFINHNNEIILETKNNVYFRLDDVNTELDFKCKIFAWVSRPISKSLSKYWASKVLQSINYLLKTNFTKDDMDMIYDRLGNDVDRTLTLRFIESGYDLSLLKRS